MFMQTSNAQIEYKKAVDLKGYGFDHAEESFFKENIERDTNFKLPDRKRIENQKLRTCSYDNLKIKPIIIETLEQYISEISKLNTTLQNPVFYRGHTNANYLLIPNVFRTHIMKEHILYNEFSRRFYAEMQHCTNTMEKLVFMQHYKMQTRALDLTESPLLGLFFACADDKRFQINEIGNKYKWGEVVLFRAPETDTNKNNNYDEDIKYSESSTVSIMANTGYMEYEFNLKKLEIKFKNDGHLGAMGESIHFKDILSNSVFVRTKKDNKRIQNQQGAFIIVNANEILLDNLDSTEFTSFVMNEQKFDVTLKNLSLGLFPKYTEIFKDVKFSDIEMRKVKPYSIENKQKNPRMYYDPFNIRRLLYRNTDNEQVVFLIPPTAKNTILSQLEKLNITDAFVYPEMDSVCNELCSIL